MADQALSILLISGGHDRAHYAFVVAAGAAALGRRVQLFATNGGCRALMRDWSLRAACVELGVTLLVCEAGLRAEAIDPRALMAGVEVAGIARFLADAAGGQFITL
jgi:predicted peroxiredoxin